MRARHQSQVWWSLGRALIQSVNASLVGESTVGKEPRDAEDKECQMPWLEEKRKAVIIKLLYILLCSNSTNRIFVIFSLYYINGARLQKILLLVLVLDFFFLYIFFSSFPFITLSPNEWGEVSVEQKMYFCLSYILNEQKIKWLHESFCEWQKLEINSTRNKENLCIDVL